MVQTPGDLTPIGSTVIHDSIQQQCLNSVQSLNSVRMSADQIESMISARGLDSTSDSDMGQLVLKSDSAVDSASTPGSISLLESVSLDIDTFTGHGLDSLPDHAIHSKFQLLYEEQQQPAELAVN